MGIINVSPESFYKGSIITSDSELAKKTEQLQKDGADIIDIGAMSTAPYNESMISIEEEQRRIIKAIKILKESCKLPISVDTPRSQIAKQAIQCGVDAINDVTGLKFDKEMASVVSESAIPVIIGAYDSTNLLKTHTREPGNGSISDTTRHLKESIKLADLAGIESKNIIVDPSIGFYREEGKNPFYTQISGRPWYVRDLEILANLKSLKALSKPICISTSRKSFIGNLLNLKTEDRLVPSIVSELISVANGANIIRTHNVRETAQALTMMYLLS
jgi:dihydropteroate synthase